MDQATLETLLAEWQKTIRLQDWFVVVQFKRIYNLSSQDVLGECCWVLSKRSACISILDPNDYDPSIISKFDVESTLVHELLHLHFAPFAAIGEETYQHEQAIDAIAKGLVDAKRMAIVPPVADFIEPTVFDRKDATFF